MSDGVPVVAVSSPEPSDCTPVVLLHGLSQQRHFWDPVVSRLHGVPTVCIDQRGHGEAAVPEVTAQTDFTMDRLADDVVEVLDHLDVPQAIIVGHSWGASVALRTAVRHSSRVRSIALIDGGLFGPRHLREVWADAPSADAVRESLRPPPLGMVEPVLWQAIAHGDLSPYWTPEIHSALQPTFTVDELGRIYTKLGPERHMAVLDGLLAYDPAPDIAELGCSAWVVVCEPREELVGDDEELSRAWQQAKELSISHLPAPFFVQRWGGALHDVPLQWPALVAGLVETIVDRSSDRRGEEGL
jgi:pimeloyl-ACP methyl ester carboxylesterase